MKITNTTRFALVIGVAAMMGSAAHANFYSSDRRVLNRVDSNVKEIKSELDSLHTTVKNNHTELIQALREQTGEQSSYADKQIEAQKRLMDAAEQNATVRMRQQYRAAAESGTYDPDPDACLFVDLLKPSSKTSTAGAQGTKLSRNVMTRMSSLAALGNTAAAREIANTKTPLQNEEDASIAANVFFDEPTLNLEDEDTLNAAEVFRVKVKDASPPADVTAEELKTPEGVARAAVLESRKARSSVADLGWGLIANMADPVMSGEELKKIAKGTPYNREVPDMVSELQVLDALTVQQYTKSIGSGDSAGVSPSVLLQRIHRVASIQARMQYIQLEMQRRDLMIQSAMLEKMIENDGDSAGLESDEK